jgi:hypothetical protein
MKNKWTIFLLLAFGVVFLVISCKSTASSAPAAAAPESAPEPALPPEPAPPPEPVPQLPSQADLEALDAAISRAESARQRAADFKADSRFPDDWAGVESDYAAAGNLRDTPEGLRETLAKYQALTDRYDELFRKTIPLYAQDREETVLAARDAAIAAGINDFYPDYLLDADRTALDAVAKYEAEDYYAADEASLLALEQYRVLKPGVEAYKLRQEIVGRDFSGYDRGNFSRADELLRAAFDHYEEKNAAAAWNEAEEALSRYTIILGAGWAGFAGKLQAQAQAERQKALNEKANVAVRNDFSETEKVYTQGNTAYRAGNYREACPFYEKSAASYTVLTKTAIAKRRSAETAIDKAEKKVMESEMVVQNAELILEGDME